MLRGKFLSLWRKYQDQYEKKNHFRERICPQNPYIKITPRKKTNRFQTFFFDVLTAAKEELWKARNQHRHCPEDMRQSNAAEKAEMEIIQLYEKETTILDCDREKSSIRRWMSASINH